MGVPFPYEPIFGFFISRLLLLSFYISLHSRIWAPVSLGEGQQLFCVLFISPSRPLLMIPVAVSPLSPGALQPEGQSTARPPLAKAQ